MSGVNYSLGAGKPLISREQNYVLDRKLLTVHSEDRDSSKWPNSNEFEIVLDSEKLSPGTYDIGLGINGSGITDWFPIVTSLNIKEWGLKNEITIHPKYTGIFIPKNNWTKIK